MLAARKRSRGRWRTEWEANKGCREQRRQIVPRNIARRKRRLSIGIAAITASVRTCYVDEVLTEAEIERRLPVWHALSDLFLDTELRPEDYTRIAASLSASSFKQMEIRTILEKEVAPAFVFNLVDVAGEWSAWSALQVRDIVLLSLRSRTGPSSLPWLKRRRSRRHIADIWSKIEPLLAEG